MVSGREIEGQIIQIETTTLGTFLIVEFGQQEKRFQAIRIMLNRVRECHIPVIYGAVNKAKVAKTVYGSAELLDVCFRVCIKGVDGWLESQPLKGVGDGSGHIVSELALVISDDYQDRKIKDQLRKSLRNFRYQLRPPTSDFKAGTFPETAWRFHDDMYFGSSKDSMGLQLADLCCYFVFQHLRGDKGSEPFYDLIKDNIVMSGVEPKDLK